MTSTRTLLQALQSVASCHIFSGRSNMTNAARCYAEGVVIVLLFREARAYNSLRELTPGTDRSRYRKKPSASLW